ncbi:MAG: hypothetical protein LBD84_02930 [Campylobacteraceae bacterium]|jgi:opacity protein-like surface antigen|nr:hypothetical protein [Campylobacteraceae bacterium]
MRILVGTAVALALSFSALSAEDNESKSTKYENEGFYLGFHAIRTSFDNKTVKDNLNIEDLIGKNGIFYELQIGGYIPATSDHFGAKYYAGLYYNHDRYDESGVLLGLELSKRIVKSIPIAIQLGIKGGYGYQSVKNDTSNGIRFADNTIVYNIQGIAGLALSPAKNLSFDLSYVYRYNHYEVTYINSANAKNEEFIKDKGHGIKLGVDLRF